MTQSLLLFGAIVLAFLIGIFSSKKTAREDAKVIDLTARIKDNIAKAQGAQKTADEQVRDYEDALKKYDSNFYTDGDDDGDGKPSA